MDEALKTDLERLAPAVDLPAAQSSFARRRRASRVRRRAATVGLSAAVVLGGAVVAGRALGPGSDGDTTVADAPTEESSDSTDDSLSDGDGDGDGGTTIARADRQWRTFVVDGVEVLVETEMEALPEFADIVELSTTIIDDGSGPRACLGGVRLSLPPQCGGLVLDGLGATGLTEESGGVRWGDRTVTVWWPPRTGALAVIDERPFDQPARPETPSGDATPATLATQDRLSAALTSTLDPPFVIGSGHGGDKLEVRMVVADRANLAALAAILPDPDAYRVVGVGALLASSTADGPAPDDDTTPTTAVDEWCGGWVDLDEEIRFRPGTVSGSVDGAIEPGRRHRYRLEARAGQLLTIHLEPVDGSTMFRLTSPSGEVVDEGVTSAETVLPETGVYRVCVVPAGGRSTSYALHANVVDLDTPTTDQQPDPEETSCPAQTVGRFNHERGTDGHDGELAEGDRDLAFVFLDVDEILQVELTSPGEEATFTVRGPESGSLLAGASTTAWVRAVDQGWHEICITAFADTTYRLEVTLDGQ